jgi:hypothetical protein
MEENRQVAAVQITEGQRQPQRAAPGKAAQQPVMGVEAGRDEGQHGEADNNQDWRGNHLEHGRPNVHGKTA